MNKYQTVKLSYVCQIESGGTPSSSNSSYWDGDIPWVTLVDVKNKYVESTNRKISLSGLNNSSAKMLPVGTVLFSSRATIGNVSIAKIELATNQGFKNFICDKNKIIPEYLYYCLKKDAVNIEASCPGTTYKEISKSKIEKHTIPLPSLEIQKRIIKALDQADALCQKRKQAIGLLDDYSKSVFLKMFGDPVRNPKGFEVACISNITSHIKDGPHVSPEYADSGTLILSTRNVRPGELVLEDVKYVSQDTFQELTRIFRPQKGDVLVTKGGTTGYAKVVDFDWPFCVWVHIAVLRPTSKIDPLYLEGAMNSDYCYRQSQLYTHGIANRDLGLTRIAKIKLLKPPLEEQQKYASIIRSTRIIKQKMITQSEELKTQFQALMQKAFKGEL